MCVAEDSEGSSAELPYLVNNYVTVGWHAGLTVCVRNHSRALTLESIYICFYFTCTPYINDVGSHTVHTLRFLFYFKLA